MGTAGLEQVDIEWSEGFSTMQVCMDAWTKMRATYDARFAVASQADNGAAYWKTPTVDVTLACNPNESGAGVMTARYVPAAAE